MRGLSDPRYASVATLYASQTLRVRAYVQLRLALRLLKAEIFDALLPSQGLVVDFGCGYGLLGNYLALQRPERRVLGIDADPRRVAVARTTVGSRGNVEFICQDLMSTTPLPPMRGAVMTDFLHHLPISRQRQSLASVAAALERGGILLIREVNPRHQPRWKYWLSVLAELVLYPDPRTTKLCNREPEELVGELRGLGLDAEMQYADKGSPFAAVLYVCRKPEPSGGVIC